MMNRYAGLNPNNTLTNKGNGKAIRELNVPNTPHASFCSSSSKLLKKYAIPIGPKKSLSWINNRAKIAIEISKPANNIKVNGTMSMIISNKYHFFKFFSVANKEATIAIKGTAK